MIIDIQEGYNISYQCDHCKRAPKMVKVYSLPEALRMFHKYGVYMSYRCEADLGSTNSRPNGVVGEGR